MDGLFSLIWVVFIVVTLTNAITGKNKKKQQKRNAVPPFTAQPVTKPEKPIAKPADFRQIRDMVATEMQARTQQAQPSPAKPQQARMNDAMTPPRKNRVSVATPKVHTHLSLDCDIDEPSGSMDYVSTEGMDPCHDGNLPGRSTPRPGIPVMQEQPGLALEWTSDALVRSVIMQEVLTRPSQRQRR